MPAAQSQVALVKVENGHLSPRKRLPHRRGKVARLPKLLRDQINQMLRDGHSYHHILEKLKTIPDAATIPISKQNLSRWKFGGYLDWLAQQEWREDLHDRQADALQLLEDPTGSRFQEVSLQIAAMRIFELLQRLQASTLSANLQDLPPGFLRLLAVLPRITREALRYQKYRDACHRARAQLQALHDPKRKLNDDERRAIVRNVDEILGLPAEPYLREPVPAETDAKENRPQSTP
jgi:hypothetical protein